MSQTTKNQKKKIKNEKIKKKLKKKKIQFTVTDKWTESTEKIPKIFLKITDSTEKEVNVTEINGDMQFTSLSDAEMFCSFYPKTVG